MKKIKRKTMKKILFGATGAAAILAAVLIVRGISGLFGGRTDTTAGVEYIQNEEAGNIAAIEEKISLLEKHDNNEEDTRSLKEKFTGAVVVGDSITAGFTEYDILNASSVAAQIGVHLYETDDLIAQVKNLGPGIIFLSLGMNDVEATNGDTEEFSTQYTAVIDKIKEELPDAHVFVNAIFPVQDTVIEQKPILAKIPDYNEVLKELCDKLRVGFIDSTELVQQEYYEQDGTHFKAEFYPIWAEHMAEVAAL